MVCWRDLQFQRENMHQLFALYGDQDSDSPLAAKYRERFEKKTGTSADSSEGEYGPRQITPIEPRENWDGPPR